MKKWCVLLVALIFSGCAHPGTKQAKQEEPAVMQEKPQLSAALVAQTIIKGKTTKKEIAEKFGPPNAVAKNTLLPSKEMLAKLTTPLPPIARTVEFWHYWTVPPTKDGTIVGAADGKAKIFRLMIFLDENGVAVDYLTEDRMVDFQQ